MFVIPFWQNFTRTIGYYVFESVKSTVLERRQTLRFIQLVTGSDRSPGVV
jgi:hypothetical protein